MEQLPYEILQQNLNRNGLEYVSFLKSIVTGCVNRQSAHSIRMNKFASLDPANIDPEDIFIRKGINEKDISFEMVIHPKDDNTLVIDSERLADGSMDIDVFRKGDDLSNFNLNLKEETGNWQVAVSPTPPKMETVPEKPLSMEESRIFSDQMKKWFEKMDGSLKDVDQARQDIAGKIIPLADGLVEVCGNRVESNSTEGITLEIIRNDGRYEVVAHSVHESQAVMTWEVGDENLAAVQGIGEGTQITVRNPDYKLLFPLDRNDGLNYTFHSEKSPGEKHSYFLRVSARKNKKPTINLDFIGIPGNQHAANITQLEKFHRVTELFRKITSQPPVGK